MTPSDACPPRPARALSALLPLLILMAAASTATAAATAQARKAPPQADAGHASFEVANQFPFDIATTLAPSALPAPVNQAMLTGALYRARPAVLECLVAPASRGPASRTLVRVDARVDGGGLHLAIDGDNLAAPGRACVERSLRRQVRVAPQPTPIAVRLEVEHVADAQPGVRLGINPASDFAGQVRLALPAWGLCFAPSSSRVPPPLTADVTITKAGGVALAFRDLPAPSRAFADCLRQRIVRVPHDTGASGKLAFPLRLWFFNSAADAGAEALEPQLRMFQFDARRDRLAGDVAVALGARTVAATGYDVVVQQYKQSPAPTLVPALFQGCATLVAASQSWVGANEAQVAHNRRIVTLAGTLAKSDPAWGALAGQAGGALNRMDAELQAARRRLAADRAACPRPKAASATPRPAPSG
jgi:hypothetical protein